jgi:hypothetical protein
MPRTHLARDVRSEPRRNRAERVVVQGVAGEPVRRPEHRRRVRAAAAQPRGDGNVLLDRYAQRRDLDLRSVRLDGGGRQVGPIDGGAHDFVHMSALDDYDVVQLERRE